jgi:UDP-N-acetylmuramate: L-alanyl-gamma-D-glutamyl-meso-diaminopimelate ligase
MNKYTLPKHIHVIGICGVATSALAIAFQKKGVEVTGSDKGFFPPVSTELEKHGISFYAGWHPEKMVKDGKPDLVVITTASGTQNPETLYVKEHSIPYLGYMEVFERYFIRDNSIVCTGTWGKTSSSSLLSYILDQAGFNPGYMFGGVSLSHDSSARITDGDWSVFEGDEYKSSPTDPTAKFFHYKPTHLLLTAVSWDHADLYPTEKDYFDAFHKLVAMIPANGLIVASKDNAGVAKVLDDKMKTDNRPGSKESSAKIVSYGKKDADYTYDDIHQSADGLDFIIHHDGQSFSIKSPMIGAFQAENITGCFATAYQIGIEPEKIIQAIAGFKGLKRRLEKRLDGGKDSHDTKGITVFDDIAHSPEKASSVLKNLREIYKGKVIAIFEPNIGGRERGAASKYDDAFKDADMVIIPRLTKLKVAEDGSEAPMEGDELTETISKTHKNARYIEDDPQLVKHLISNAEKDDVIVFLGSHGFRGMIEETIKGLAL